MYVTFHDAPPPTSLDTICMEAQRLVLALSIELTQSTNAAAPSGWLGAPDTPPRRFESYVQLIGVVEELRAEAALAQAAAPDGEPRRA